MAHTASFSSDAPPSGSSHRSPAVHLLHRTLRRLRGHEEQIHETPLPLPPSRQEALWRRASHLRRYGWCGRWRHWCVAAPRPPQAAPRLTSSPFDRQATPPSWSSSAYAATSTRLPQTDSRTATVLMVSTGLEGTKALVGSSLVWGQTWPGPSS